MKQQYLLRIQLRAGRELLEVCEKLLELSGVLRVETCNALAHTLDQARRGFVAEVVRVHRVCGVRGVGFGFWISAAVTST